MTPEVTILLGSAAVLGVTHTLLGPDHYIPFIALGRARNWSAKRTLAVTTLCGIGHVLSSVLIGLAGLVLGTQLFKLEAIEALRGELAAWLLFGFGLAYLVWGIQHALKSRACTNAMPQRTSGAWILFVIFVLGPCEPLIPLLLVPAASVSASALFAVSGVFLLCTVGTMLGAVAIGYKSVTLFNVHGVQHYAHALAGGALTSCAALMLFLGM